MQSPQELNSKAFTKSELLHVGLTFAFTALIASIGFLGWYRYNHLRIRDLENKVVQAEAQKEALLKTYCKGTWQNGTCINTSCLDSDANKKPSDTYTKGNVTYTGLDGSTKTIEDDCSESNLQVKENWCYENPTGSGNYIVGTLVEDCPNGCSDGACINVIQESDTNAIKLALSQKFNKPVNEVNLNISKGTATHAFGSVRFTGEPAGAWWLGVKENTAWKIVASGNGNIFCKDIEPYDFPSTIVPECYDDTTNSAVTR